MGKGETFSGWTILFVLAIPTFLNGALGLQLTISETEFPSGDRQCHRTSHVQALYNGDDLVYVFCRYSIYKYTISSDTLVYVTDTPWNFPPTFSASWGPHGEIYLFGSFSNPRVNIWKMDTSDDEWTWTHILEAEFDFVSGSAVWDGQDTVYLYGGSWTDPTVWKFSTTEHVVVEAGTVAANASMGPAVVWVPEQTAIYVFGGSTSELSISRSVVKYDPDTETAFSPTSLPVGFVDGGVVWTGSSVYLLCAGLSWQPSNFIQFDPFTLEPKVEQVDGFDFHCKSPGTVYVNQLNRIYMFGGSTGYSEHRIMYIDLNESGTTGGSTETSPTTVEQEPVRGLKLVISANVRLPDRCAAGEAYYWTSAVYDGDDLVYIFCAYIVLVYQLSTDQLVNSARWIAGWRTTPWMADGKILAFMWGYDEEVGTATTDVWEGQTNNLSDWTNISSLPYEWHSGATVWNGADDIYVIYANGPRDIKKFSITDHTWTDSVTWPEWRQEVGAVWAGEENGVFIFGGRTQGTPGYSHDILNYDPQGNNITHHGYLPIPVSSPGVVWTGKYAYLTCAPNLYLVHDTSKNLIRFDPVLNKAVVVPVAGWDFPCYSTPSIYSAKLNRIYMFGGTYGDREQPLMYIDLNDEEDSTTTPTERSSTSSVAASSTLEPPSSTTEMRSTTTIPDPSKPGCIAVDKYGTLYEAAVGQTASRPCPGLSNGTATWFCMPEDVFDGENPDYSTCTSLWLIAVADKIEIDKPINSTEAFDLLHEIQRFLLEAADPNSGVTYFGHEIKFLFHIGETIMYLVAPETQMSDSEQLTGITFEVFDQLLKHGSPWEELTQRGKAETGTVFIQASDNTALRLGHRKEAATPTPGGGYRKAFHGLAQFEIMSGTEPLPLDGNGNGEQITFPHDFMNSRPDSYIELPSDWAKYFSGQEYVAFAGLKLSHVNATALFPAPAPEPSDAAASIKILDGPLMSFTFGTPEDAIRDTVAEAGVNFTGPGVRITFHHVVTAYGPDRTQLRRRLHPGETPKAVLGSGVCVYWDAAELVWSPEGCKLVSSKPEHTICECKHLTAFAVVMDLHQYVGKSVVLEVMTWLLCPLSLVCLLITVAVFLYSRYGWKPLLSKHPSNDLTLNLCVALLVANFLILVTMDKHDLHLSDGVCTGFAIVLHYTLLCAFAWMALEGILLARLVYFDVFASGREHETLERAGAFGVPAAIVVVTCGVNFGQGDHAYGNDAFCWLHGGYSWSFIVVVAMVLIFNAAVLVMSIRKSYKLEENPNRRHSSVRKPKTTSFWIRGALSLTAIMGLTWVFGLLMLVDNATVANVAAYLFTASNASQGIFIFVFHIASNKKVRSHFRSLALTTFTMTKTTSGVGDATSSAAAATAVKGAGSEVQSVQDDDAKNGQSKKATLVTSNS